MRHIYFRKGQGINFSQMGKRFSSIPNLARSSMQKAKDQVVNYASRALGRGLKSRDNELDIGYGVKIKRKPLHFKPINF